MYGLERDYFIAEVTIEGEEPEEVKEGDEEEVQEPNVEERGTGVNKYAYYVTNEIVSGSWTRLPDLKPSQLRAARQIKVTFTGDLERKIMTNPFFFGLEMHYLRAQIARISHSTTIFPRKMWKLVEDSEREIEEAVDDEGEPVPFPSVLTLANADEWGH